MSSKPAAPGSGVSVRPRKMIGVFGAAHRLGAWLAAVLTATSLFGGLSVAQGPSAAGRETLQARKEALFQQTLRDPANLDTVFAYADVSAKLGDNEAAVAALERMLLFNPNLPRVQLELGALYFRMGSYEIARTYFEKALAANPPPEVRSRVESYVDELARLSSPQRFSGFLFSGVQYQSNANLAPGSAQVLTPFGPATLNPEFVKRSDVNIFGTGSVLYAYDLGTQDRDTFELGGTSFANHYFNVDRLDLGLVEATAGPRFNFADPMPGVRSAAVKPYVIANYVALGGSPYFQTLGVGTELNAGFGEDLRLKSVFEFRNKNFQDSAERPLSRGLTGSDKVFSLLLSRPITTAPASELSLEFDLLSQDTRLAYYSNMTYGGALAYRIRYDDPTGFLHRPWETTIFFSGNWAEYDAPDPSVSSNPLVFVPTVRSDQRLRVGLTQSFEVVDKVALIVQLQRDIVSSNLPLYGYTSNSVLVGPQIKF